MLLTYWNELGILYIEQQRRSTMNIKNEKMNDKGLLESLCEGFGLLASYVMVFVLLWEGILGMAGAK